MVGSNSVRAGAGWGSVPSCGPNQAKGDDSDHLDLVSVRLPTFILDLAIFWISEDFLRGKRVENVVLNFGLFGFLQLLDWD